MLCDLLPHGGVFVHGCLSDLFIGGAEVLPPAAVPVNVDDAVHIIVKDIAHDLVDSVEILGGDGVFAVL